MKMSKLLPITLALVFATTCVSFADGEPPVIPDDVSVESVGSTGEEGTSDYTLTLLDYYHITPTWGTQTATASYKNDYKHIHLDTAFNPSFEVVSNKVSDNISFYATCPVSGGVKPAIYSEAGAYRLVFTNTDHLPTDFGNVPTATTMAGSAKSSRDAIAFLLEQDYSAVEADQGNISDPVFKADKGGFNYTIKNGRYNISYTVGQDDVDNSFNAADSQGTYQATLYMQRTAL